MNNLKGINLYVSWYIKSIQWLFGVPKYHKLIQSFIDLTSFSIKTYTVVGIMVCRNKKIIERLSFTYMANGKWQIQVENFST